MNNMSKEEVKIRLKKALIFLLVNDVNERSKKKMLTMYMKSLCVVMMKKER